MTGQTKNTRFVIPMQDVGMGDVALVGGKNASLGEMIRKLGPRGVRVPGGFVVTADAYRHFLKHATTKSPGKSVSVEQYIRNVLKGLNVKKLKELSRRGRMIRETIKGARFPRELENAIIKGYRVMEKEYGGNVDVAVRSSATAEDLPGASFAGEHETYLNIRGKKALLSAVKSAMASLFTDRAISYRVDKGFDHFRVALSVGVQKMVRSDKGCSGVMFTLDTESGFKDVVLINGSWGLGEMIVKGEVIPDEFLVFKKTKTIIEKKFGVKDRKMIYSTGSGIKTTKIVPASSKEKNSFVLSEREVLVLADWGVKIEEHYSKLHKKWTPMDIEWAKDGISNQLFIVQARPETVHAERDFSKIQEYARIGDGKEIVRGASVGSKIAIGKARVILDPKRIFDFQKGEILVTDMTDPDWEPIMKIASAIVTDKGGRTSHAAIVSRELGIPCIVGTGNATKKIKTGKVITVDTTGSEGYVFAGKMRFKTILHDVKKFPRPKTKIMMNIAMPDLAFEQSFLPNSGVGLAREEFIIASQIGVHPLAILNFKKCAPSLRREILRKTRGWRNIERFYVEKLAFGIAKIGAAFYPNPVIVRFSDFKTNEYRSLLGGGPYEPVEENPMIGWRGASRYYDPKFKDAFALECRALSMARSKIGLKNIIPMVPFCRTPQEGRNVVEIMAKNGLDRKKDKRLKIYMMCEIPSNVVRAGDFLRIFNGMSIGSNDLTQLTLGLDRDSGIVSKVANENDEAVKILVRNVIKTCRARKKYIGICGQAPSDYPEFAKFLVDAGIESISLNPDSIIPATLLIYRKEKQRHH